MISKFGTFFVLVLLAGCSSPPKLSWPNGKVARIPINTNYAKGVANAAPLSTRSPSPVSLTAAPLSAPELTPVQITPEKKNNLPGVVVGLVGSSDSDPSMVEEQGFFNVKADGKSKVTFKASVNDPSGKPAGQGVVVQWATNLGNIASPTSITDASGIATMVLTAPKVSGWATVTTKTDKTETKSAIVRYCTSATECRDIGVYSE